VVDQVLKQKSLQTSGNVPGVNFPLYLGVAKRVSLQHTIFTSTGLLLAGDLNLNKIRLDDVPDRNVVARYRCC